MEDQNKITPRPIFQRSNNWDPFSNWTQPSRILSQDSGLPSFLEPSDVDWLEWARRRLESFSTKGPLLSPFSGQHLALNRSDLKQLTGGVSEMVTGEDVWKIQLDVKHFSPDEITVTAKEGYLQISGKHEERQDEQGSVSRCFTRKYKLPQGVNLQHVCSSLTPDGHLSVEAPVAGADSTGERPDELVIPVQIGQPKDKR